MDDQTLVIVVGAVFFGIVIIAIVSWFAQQRKNEEREQEFTRLATQYGLHFIAEDNSYSGRYDDGQKPFRTLGGKARNILQGSYRGRAVCVFEYRYTTTSSNGQTTSSTTHHFPIWVVGLPAAAPLFTVGAEGMFGGKVASALGFERLDIGDKAFDDAFKVKCDDEQFGRRVLHPAVIDLLRRTGPWDWRFSGPNMISYSQGVFEAAAAMPQLDLMCDLLDLVPADAWTRTGR
ncbi:hypothetical protein GCM10011575_30210 [Microlunatus endophyticus]|uniref:DUF3137 domain-containing protein n=1 Tax=Microlunatus endophyticus TaxID=1716077 RepID=A0A917SB78_9ACTN|nr:hypothetical protein [Microlunatus endophyticus]GGL69546.1 hypothetical protein GCM10011575_30210 [Microlunatus endophyticus]